MSDHTYYLKNKERILARQKARYKAGLHWTQTHPEEAKVRNREFSLKRNFGLDIEAVDLMTQTQDGCCAVCGCRPAGRRKTLHVDHDHRTGRVRALLCNKCNIGIGMFDENTSHLSAAIDYLRRYAA